MLNLPPLRLGSRGPEVQNWQRFLNETTDAGLSADGAFGPRTAHATRAWQVIGALKADGIVGAKSRELAIAHGFVQFLEARHLTRTAGRTIDLIIIHDMEYPETPTSAEWCAQFFAGPHAPHASAHYSIDRDSIVQSVRDEDVAWHAPGANHDGIGLEHAGYAKQSRAEWLDDYSRAELDREFGLGWRNACGACRGDCRCGTNDITRRARGRACRSDCAAREGDCTARGDAPGDRGRGREYRGDRRPEGAGES